MPVLNDEIVENIVGYLVHSGVSESCFCLSCCFVYLDVDICNISSWWCIGLLVFFPVPKTKEEPGPWTCSKHFNACGQSCGCCRSHNREDHGPCVMFSECNCSYCMNGWVLTTISPGIRKLLLGSWVWLAVLFA